MRLKSAGLLICIVCIALISLTSCNQEVLQGTISEAGSTTIQPLAEKLAREFMNEYPKVTVKVDGGGSGEGIGAVSRGDIDIGAASRELKEGEPELNKVLIGRDGIAIVVHPNNPVNNLTLEQVKDIFTGEIEQWSEINDYSGEIIVVCRAEGSGTRDAFEELVMGHELIKKDVVFEPSNIDMRSYVSINPEAIGFLSVGYIDHTVKALSIEGIECSLETCQNGEYTLVRPLYFLTSEEASDLVNAFLEFSVSSRGQGIIAEEGFIPIR